MKKFLVDVTHIITAEQISSLLCSALEGGSNYWYTIDKIVKPAVWEFDSNETPDTHYAHDYPLNPGGALLIRSLEDDEYGSMRLDTEAVLKGLKVLAEKYPAQIEDILNENADANTGDIFLQCCLFGDVIYS